MIAWAMQEFASVCIHLGCTELGAALPGRPEPLDRGPAVPWRGLTVSPQTLESEFWRRAARAT